MEEIINNEVYQAPQKPKRKKVKESTGDRVYYIITYIVLGLLAAIVIYPIWFVIIASFSSADAVLAGKVFLYPVDIDFAGYVKVFQRADIWQGLFHRDEREISLRSLQRLGRRRCGKRYRYGVYRER